MRKVGIIKKLSIVSPYDDIHYNEIGKFDEIEQIEDYTKANLFEYDAIIGSGIDFFRDNVGLYQSLTKNNVKTGIFKDKPRKHQIVDRIHASHTFTQLDTGFHNCFYVGTGVSLSGVSIIKAEKPSIFIDHFYHTIRMPNDKRMHDPELIKSTAIAFYERGFDTYFLGKNGIMKNDFTFDYDDYKPVPRDELFDLISKCHYFICTHMETFGLTAIEAATMDCQIISKREWLFPEVFENLNIKDFSEIDYNTDTVDNAHIREMYSWEKVKDKILTAFFG